MSHPKLRFVEAHPITHEGQPQILLRDPQNLTDGFVVISPGGFLVAAMLTGENSVVDIQAEIMRRTGQLVTSDQISGVIDSLDRSLLLDNERFHEHLRQTVEAFHCAPVREPTCAGRSYEEDPEKLQEQVWSYFEPPEGPGRPEDRITESPIRAIIAPHIDYPRGGTSYAHVYRKLAQSPPIDLFVILGTGHAGPCGDYAFTKKDFRTPLGTVKTDAGFIERIEASLGTSLTEEEFVHRSEHSVELQLVFLQVVCAHWPPPKIVPVLCGGFHEAVQDGRRPTESQNVARFLAALRDTISAYPGRVCVLASADLSHVGPQFGDPRPVSDRRRRQVAAQDQAMLETVQKLDAEAFFQNVQEEKNERNVCGVGAIYTLLHVAGARDAEQVNYGQAADPEGALCVTFCGMIFH
jgi:AmmeMemoRadiSam system protein B